MREFRPQLLPTVVAALVFAALIGLGRWQLDRMHEKQTLFASFAAGGRETLPLSAVSAGEDMRYQHVQAPGHYLSDRQFLLDNMTHEGRAGYRVLTPFVTSYPSPSGRGAGVRETGEDRSSILLVDRGWIPAGAMRSQLPDIRVTEQLRTVSGRLDLPPRRGIDLPAAPATGWPRVLTYPKIGQLSEALGRPVFEYILLLDADQSDGYVRDWKPSTFPPERHWGYAVTWFTLAAALAVLYFVSQLRRRP